MRHIFTAAVLAAAVLMAVFPVACAADEEKVTGELFAMDTIMTLTAYGQNAEAGIKAAEDEIHRLDALLSTGSEESEVSEINRRSAEGKLKTVTLSEDSSALMEESLQLYEDTDGAFDITVYPLMQLWGFTSGNYHVPTEEELREVMRKVGADGISYDEETREAAFSKKGMEIDFGGIAKGYTSSRIMDVFRDAGVTSALVSLGGNVQVLGTKPEGKLWKIGIQNPAGDGTFLGILETADEAVITSGGYERFFEENGTVYHHILDAATGRPARSGLASVTIVSGDGMLADGLSTALFVMGKEKAADYWKAHNGEFQMVLYTEDGKLYATEGLKDSLSSDLEVEYIHCG